MNLNKQTEAIYDWLEQFDFNELNEQQQAQVLQEMDQDQYTEMRMAFAALQSSGRPAAIRGKAAIRNEVMASFNVQEKRGLVAMFSQRVHLGKVAAVFLLFSVSFALLYSTKSSTIVNQPSPQTADTVYIVKEKEVPVAVYDTVYETKYIATTATKKIKPQTSTEVRPTQDVLNLNIVSATDRNNTANTSRKNSFKHDGLVGKFGFVSM